MLIVAYAENLSAYAIKKPGAMQFIINFDSKNNFLATNVTGLFKRRREGIHSEF